MSEVQRNRRGSRLPTTSRGKASQKREAFLFLCKTDGKCFSFYRVFVFIICISFPPENLCSFLNTRLLDIRRCEVLETFDEVWQHYI